MSKKNRTPAQLEYEATRALQLHSQGMSTRAIAAKLTEEGMPISQPTVSRRIQHALESYVIPARAEAKAQELARIDAVLEAQSAKLADGDSKAADIVLKAVALRSKILGLDAPQQQAEAPAPAITSLLEQARLRAVK